MNVKYYIKDENNNYVDRLSIFMVEGIYYYKSFLAFISGCRRYIDEEKANEVLKFLQRNNKLAGFNHTFTIVEVIEDNIQYFKPLIQIKGSNEYTYKNTFTAYAMGLPIEFETDLNYEEFERFINGEYSKEEIEQLENDCLSELINKAGDYNE